MAHSALNEEQALIEGLKTGNEQSYKEAVRTFTPGMLAVARFYLDNSSAEEIVQDCWVTVIDAVQKFEGRSGLKTWLHRIVANRCKNRLRSTKREVSTDFSEALEPELGSGLTPRVDGICPQNCSFTTQPTPLWKTAPSVIAWTNTSLLCRKPSARP